MTCAVPSCDKPQMKRFDLCKEHRRRQREGRPLVGRKGLGGHNKKYTDDMTCEFETCDKKPVTNYRCMSHDWQMRKYGMMWPVGEARPGKTYKTKEGRWNGYMGTEYAPQRTCERCGETKDWQRFCLGTEHMKDVCRDCNRKALSQRVDVLPVNGVGQARKKTNQGQKNWEALMEFLNRTNSDSSQ